jgi:hypothetical protein
VLLRELEGGDDKMNVVVKFLKDESAQFWEQ